MIENTSTRKYWLCAPGQNANLWDEFYDLGIIALGWDELGDLNDLGDKDQIRDMIKEVYNKTGNPYNDVLANLQFRDTIAIGDIMIPKKGREDYLGYGIVTSDYYYDENRASYKSCRKIDWKKKGLWKEPDGEVVLKTLTDITKYPGYIEKLNQLIGIELDDTPVIKKTSMQFPLNTIFYGPPGTGKTYNTILRAAEIVAEKTIGSYPEALQLFKENLHNQIEFITFHQNYSYEDFIQGLRPNTENDRDLTFERKDGVFKVIADKALKNILAAKNSSPKTKQSFEKVFSKYFHPLISGEVEEMEVKMAKVSYFITNISNNGLEFRKASGGTSHNLSLKTLERMYEAESVDQQGLAAYYAPLLKQLLNIGKNEKSENEKVAQKNYVIIIDEINRANISRVFGELITLIEPDKRSHGEIPLEVKLPSGDLFMVPSNLYIIGTMNTADKSIALLDIALRRRFEFEPMYPKYEIPNQTINDVDTLRVINAEIIKSKGHDFQIGHSYFMDTRLNLVDRMNKKVIPLLLEYYMNDEKEVKGILSKAGFSIENGAWPLKVEAQK